MSAIDPEETKPDLISSIATYGAPTVVLSLLAYRIYAGHWGSVAFMVVLLTVSIVTYLYFVPLGDLDEDD